MENNISNLRSSWLFWLSRWPIYRDLVEQLTRLWSDSWRTARLTICLSGRGPEDSRTWGLGFRPVTGYVLIRMTQDRDAERWGRRRKSRTELREISDNSISLSLDIFSVYCDTKQGTKSACMLSFEGRTKFKHTLMFVLCMCGHRLTHETFFVLCRLSYTLFKAPNINNSFHTLNIHDPQRIKPDFPLNSGSR